MRYSNGLVYLKLNILKENKMTIKRLVIVAIFILFICTVLFVKDRKKNNVLFDSKGMIERWNRVEGTITYSKIDLDKYIATVLEQKNVITATVLEQKYVIDTADSSFIFEGKKIYLFEDKSKTAKFSDLAEYFDNHLPSINVDIEITLWISAIIDENGKAEHVGIVKNPDYYSYILPTIDVVTKMPNWSPAHIGDEKVASLVIFPVHHKAK
jgi:hypothetical protein